MTPKLKKVDWRELFQPDNKPKHTAKIVEKFLKKKTVQTVTWLIISPDLKPIKHIWRATKLLHYQQFIHQFSHFNFSKIMTPSLRGICCLFPV